jgi:hypothetical protein
MVKDNSMEIEAGLLLLYKYAPAHLTERAKKIAKAVIEFNKQAIIEG